MNIWLINHYAVPPQYYPLARTTNFARFLMKQGHEVTIFAASTVHNDRKNLIEDGRPWREETVDGIRYVYIRCCNYRGNGPLRIWNILQFAARLKKVCGCFPKPEVLLASSSPLPFSCMAGLKLAREYGCKALAEVTDLCPQNLVEYGYLGEKNPIAQWLYRYERKMYELCDALIFSFEGGKDYVIERGWTGEGKINPDKIHYINNGVDLTAFDAQVAAGDYSDPDLDESGRFKVVYTGSIRLVNRVHELVHVAGCLRDRGREDILLLLYGAGDQVGMIQTMIDEAGLTNIKLKGVVPKSTVPQVLAKSDLNVYMLDDSPMQKYGLSLNKSFEYFASGKPVLASRNSGYSIIDQYRCGHCLDEYTPEKMAEEIIRFADMPEEEYRGYCLRARQAGEAFDFTRLTDKLVKVMEAIDRP